MKLLKFLMLLFVCLAAGISSAQLQPIVDPDPTLGGYGGLVGARALAANTRGGSQSNRGVFITRPMMDSFVVGSKSYEYVIPIVHLGGRIGMDLNINCYYNSAVWGLNPTGSSVTFNIDRDFPSYGFRCDFGYAEYDSANDQFILTENDGTKHAITNPNGTGLYNSNDGSYINYTWGTNIAVFRDGTQIQYAGFPSQGVNRTMFRPTRIMDRNGNYFSISYVSGGPDQQISSVSDSLGRVINYNYDPQGRLSSITQAVHSYTDPSGTKTYATFLWDTVALNYNFSLTVSDSPANGTIINVLKKCTYPNGTAYVFSYGDWGIINRIEHWSSNGTLQSYVSFNYPTAAVTLADVPTFTQKTVSPDNSHTFVWTNVFTNASLGQVANLTSTDPNGNITVTNLDSNGYTSSVVRKNNAGTALATNGYTYTTSGGGTVLASSTRTYNDVGVSSSVQYTYDSNGNATHINEYDWGNHLVRQTVTTFAVGAYLTHHILNLPTQVLVENAAGTVIARTDLAYDGSSLTSTTGAANHDDTDFPSTFLTRGNLTSTTRYANAAGGTGAVTRALTYDTLGNVLTAQADCCVLQTFTFSSTTQRGYPDSVVTGPGTGPQFTESFTYNLDNGLVFSETDANGQVTSFQYDSMNRPTVTTPPSPGAVTTNTYGDTGSLSTIAQTNNANSLQTVQSLDAAGELLEIDNDNGGTLVGESVYAYDGVGQRTQASNPFGPGETAVNTTFDYDALGRATQITPASGGSTQYSYSGNAITVTDPAGKQRINFTDALGRLVEVNEPGWGDAVKATATVNVSGNMDRSICTLVFHSRCITTVWDSGTVTLTANGFSKTVPYGQLDTSTSVATNLAAMFHGDSAAPDATSLGSVITLVARTAGLAGNSFTLSDSNTTNDSADFPGGSFLAVPATSTFQNGLDAVPQTSPMLARPLTTTYAYDVLNNLTSSAQAAMLFWNGQQITGQPRTYVFDGLSRLTSSTTPEQGTITNFFTTSGGLSCADDPTRICRIQDARGLIKTFTYDGANRVTTVAYSDTTPGQTYTYDTGGSAAFALQRLTKVTEGATNSQTLSYDSLGRVTSVSNVIDTSTYLVQYGYNALDQPTSITYPSGRIVTQAYDAIGRPYTTASGGSTYLTVTSYNAFNQPLGTQFGNAVLGTFTYNDHMQLSTLRYNLPTASTDVLNLAYDYGTTNNGQIKTMHYYTTPGTEDLTKTENFTYDPWTRLQSAQTSTVNSTAGTWSLQWAYDELGNRLSQTLVGGNVSIGQPLLSVNTNTNRITGFSYDASGNMTADSVNTYTYDAASRLTQVNAGAGTYTYFGGLRIKKAVGAGTTVYVYSADRPIAEYLNGSLNKEYLYAGSHLLATLASGAVTYHHPDHLSNRAETDGSGNVLRSFGHFPFGETWYETPSTDKTKFTTYERDSESGLDYSSARFDSTGLARFTSVDPLPGLLANPESLNRYSYVTNDPVNFLDPTGMAGIPGIMKVCMLDNQGNNTSKCAGVDPSSGNVGGGNGGDTFGWANDPLNSTNPWLQGVTIPPPDCNGVMGCTADAFSDPLDSPQTSNPLGVGLSQYNNAISTLVLSAHQVDLPLDDGSVVVFKFKALGSKQPTVQTMDQIPGNGGLVPPTTKRSLGTIKAPKLSSKFKKTGSSQVVPLLSAPDECSALYALQILLGTSSDSGSLAYCSQ